MDNTPQKPSLEECEERGQKIAQRTMAQDEAIQETLEKPPAMAFDVWPPLCARAKPKASPPRPLIVPDED